MLPDGTRLVFIDERARVYWVKANGAWEFNDGMGNQAPALFVHTDSDAIARSQPGMSRRLWIPVPLDPPSTVFTPSPVSSTPTTHPTPPPRDRLLWALVDLDGTLAEPRWTAENPTSEIGTPIWRNVAKVRALHEAGYKIVIHTSRADTDIEAIEMWLNYYGIPFREIRTGKPLGAIYVDDRAVHADDDDWLAALRRINGE